MYVYDRNVKCFASSFVNGLLLVHCLMFLPLCGGRVVFGPCLVMWF